MWGVNRGIPNEAQDGGGDEPARSCRRQRSSGKDPCRRSWPWSTRTRCWVRRGWSALRFTWPWGSRQRVLLCITDYPVGLQPAIQRVYPGAEWPRCVKHMIRSCLAQVRVQDRGAVVEQLHGVYRAESRREALENLRVAVSPVGGRIQPRCCGSMMRDHKFPASAAVLKLPHLGEKQERRWTERRRTGFAAVQETSQRMLEERYAPTQIPTRDLLPPLKRRASSSRKTHTDIGIRPQDPCDGLPLQRREFGPVQPYGLIWAQAKPFSQDDQGGVLVSIADPAALALKDPVLKRELVKPPAGEALLGGGLVSLHGNRRREAVPQPRLQSADP
jgi:putative transposase